MIGKPLVLSFPQILIISEISLLLSQILRAVIWSYDIERKVFYFGVVALDTVSKLRNCFSNRLKYFYLESIACFKVNIYQRVGRHFSID